METPQLPATQGDFSPDELDELKLTKHQIIIQTLLDSGSMQQAKAYDAKFNVGFFTKTTKSKKWLDQFITIHPQMLDLKQTIIRLADPTLHDPVLIQGESGTGKELLAQALHGDRTGNFVAINCAGMPETLVESELFGYEKGSFTGANKEGSIGLIELAAQDKDGNQAIGTLFLDEIGELPLPSQAKLLRVLQDGRIRKVGGKHYKEVKFRLVCATHHKLGALDNIRFRRDLYYRISTFEVSTLPLSDRREDIPLIIRHLAPELFSSLTTPQQQVLFQGWLANVKAKDLSGNVRELQSLVRRYQILGK